ncbi:MAG: AraC family transcriptional regulator [Bacilli bacterium]|nr:AraC family transcriptional regulator [Bacilli bacterium]
MADILEPKYFAENDSFSIQYMYRKGYSSMPEPHDHPFYEIYYLLLGERVYFMNGKVFTARSGDMVIINPNVLHSTSSSDVPEFERILIQFKHEFIQPDIWKRELPLLPFAEGSQLLHFSLKDGPEIKRLISEMLSECKEQQEGYVTAVRTLITNLLIRIYRCQQQNPAEPVQYAHPMHQKITEIASYLNEHYYQDLTLEQLSKQFYISQTYLSRIFMKLTGFHFREYLQVIRVRQAQRRLIESQDKIQTIAEQTGFKQIAHFNKTFKKIAGISPLRYRKQNQFNVQNSNKSK